MEIKDVLKLENIKIIDEKLHWKDAIHKACEDLIRGGFVTEDYPQGIIDNTLELGPYYVLVEDLAFLHARPEQGALENQMAITVNKEVVEFSEDESHNARLLLTLAAKDSEEHLEVMRVLAELFSNEEKIQKIVDAHSPEEVYDLMMDE